MPELDITSELLSVLIQKFDETELRDLCFDLQIEFENLPGVGKGAKARELVEYCRRHDLLQELKARIGELRPAEKIKADSLSSQIAPKLEGASDNLITRSECVPIFTQGQSHLTATMMSNVLIIDFSNDQTWSGIAFVFTPKLDVRGFTHLNISGTATQHFAFQIEYKVRVGNELKIVTSSSFQSFPATVLVSTISIPLRYDGTVGEITFMFYGTGEASHVTIESFRLLK